MSLVSLAEHLGAPPCLGCARPGSLVCSGCRVSLRPAWSPRSVPNIDRVVAAWDYDGIARSLVLALKVRGRRAAAVDLGAAIARCVWRSGCAAEALVWVPGRARDIRERGFDHARLIANEVGAALGIPSIPALSRTGDRADQTTLGATERKANLRGAFVATRVPASVAVVDDLMTTGATLSEAGRALRAAGATRVDGLLACSVA